MPPGFEVPKAIGPSTCAVELPMTPLRTLLRSSKFVTLRPAMPEFSKSLSCIHERETLAVAFR